MEYLTIDEVAKKWGIGIRRVQLLCSEGKIEGAVRFGRDWMIPKDAVKPIDGRTKAGRTLQNENMPMPRKTPFLYMTDLYSIPGTADSVGESLSYNHEAQVLFEAEVAYSRGDIDKVYKSANYLLNKHSGFYAMLSAGMLLAMCAIWKGDIDMWRKAKVHISEAPAQNDDARDAMLLAISAVDIMLYNVDNFPEWFKMGCFEPLHKDSMPAAAVYYAKYLYAVGYAVATGIVKRDGVQGLSLMSALLLMSVMLLDVTAAPITALGNEIAEGINSIREKNGQEGSDIPDTGQTEEPSLEEIPIPTYGSNPYPLQNNRQILPIYTWRIYDHFRRYETEFNSYGNFYQRTEDRSQYYTGSMLVLADRSELSWSTPTSELPYTESRALMFHPELTVSGKDGELRGTLYAEKYEYATPRGDSMWNYLDPDQVQMIVSGRILSGNGELWVYHQDGNRDGLCDLCGEETLTTGLSGGAVSAIVTASVLLIGVCVFTVIWFFVKKKNWAELGHLLVG